MARRSTSLSRAAHRVRRSAHAFVSWPLMAVAGLFVASAAGAQALNNDYYKGAGTELLRNVERYHLSPAREKLKARQFESGFGEVGFMLNYFPNHPQALMLLLDYCEQWNRAVSRCNVPE